MDEHPHQMVLRERKIDMLRVLELQDEIWQLTVTMANLPTQGLPRTQNDDDSYLAIAALVGTLAELAVRVQEADLGGLVSEVDQAWKEAVAGMRD